MLVEGRVQIRWWNCFQEVLLLSRIKEDVDRIGGSLEWRGPGQL